MCNVCFLPDCVGCPVFENNVIVEQPAELLTLSEKYVNAATSFIEQNASE